jgi:hypothetical protein
LLPFLLTACFHRTHHTPPQQIAPPLPPSTTIETSRVDLPPSSSTIPTRPTQNVPAQPQTAPARRPPRHKKPAPRPAQEAASNPAPAVSAIGQLSSGDPAGFRRQTEESIASTERGLNGLNRQLSAPEQKTAAQIREFLRQARQALASGDVGGAHTLAAKAKVLLAELTR